MNLQLKKWIIGALNAALAGASGGVLMVLIDPHDFNFETGYKKLLSVMGAFALVAVAGYIQKHPIAADDAAR